MLGFLSVLAYVVWFQVRGVWVATHESLLFVFLFQMCPACFFSHFFLSTVRPWSWLQKGLVQCVVYERDTVWLLSFFYLFFLHWFPGMHSGGIGVKWWWSLPAVGERERKGNISRWQWAAWKCGKWNERRRVKGCVMSRSSDMRAQAPCPSTMLGTLPSKRGCNGIPNAVASLLVPSSPAPTRVAFDTKGAAATTNATVSSQKNR